MGEKPELMKIIFGEETLTAQARKVLTFLMMAAVASAIAWMSYGDLISYRGLPSGKFTANGYLIKEHNRMVKVTVNEYWFVRFLGLIAFASWIALFLSRSYYRHSGALQRKSPNHV
jgi:hypothetical protein